MPASLHHLLTKTKSEFFYDLQFEKRMGQAAPPLLFFNYEKYSNLSHQQMNWPIYTWSPADVMKQAIVKQTSCFPLVFYMEC